MPRLLPHRANFNVMRLIALARKVARKRHLQAKWWKVAKRDEKRQKGRKVSQKCLKAAKSKSALSSTDQMWQDFVMPNVCVDVKRILCAPSRRAALILQSRQRALCHFFCRVPVARWRKNCVNAQLCQYYSTVNLTLCVRLWYLTMNSHVLD